MSRNTHQSRMQDQNRLLYFWRFGAPLNSQALAFISEEKSQHSDITPKTDIMTFFTVANWHQKMLKKFVPERCLISELRTPMHHPTFNFSKVVRPENGDKRTLVSLLTTKMHFLYSRTSLASYILERQETAPKQPWGDVIKFKRNNQSASLLIAWTILLKGICATRHLAGPHLSGTRSHPEYLDNAADRGSWGWPDGWSFAFQLQ